MTVAGGDSSSVGFESGFSCGKLFFLSADAKKHGVDQSSVVGMI